MIPGGMAAVDPLGAVAPQAGAWPWLTGFQAVPVGPGPDSVDVLPAGGRQQEPTTPEASRVRGGAGAAGLAAVPYHGDPRGGTEDTNLTLDGRQCDHVWVDTPCGRLLCCAARCVVPGCGRLMYCFCDARRRDGVGDGEAAGGVMLQPPQDPGPPVHPPAPPLPRDPQPCMEAAERQMPEQPPQVPLWQPPQQPQQQPQQPQQQLRQQVQQQQPQGQGWQQPSHPPPTSPPPSPPHQWPQQPQLPQWTVGHSLGAGPPGPGPQQGLADGAVGGARVGETIKYKLLALKANESELDTSM